MALPHDTPFTVLTFIAAPAVLTNASSLLALGTGNRFARAVDRQRQLSALLESADASANPQTAAMRVRQLRRTEERGQLLLRALTRFYVSLGSFAFAALVSLAGAVVGGLGEGHPYLSAAGGVVAMLGGLGGVGGIMTGCALLVRETRLALSGLREEAEFSRRYFRIHHPGAAADALDAPKSIAGDEFLDDGTA